MIRKNIMLLSLVFFLTGCVRYQWVKAGASGEEMNKQLISCQAAALKSLPPDNVITSKSKDYYKAHKDEDKRSDTSYNVRDANESKRDILVKNCMYSKGWDQIRIQN